MPVKLLNSSYRPKLIMGKASATQSIALLILAASGCYAWNSSPAARVYGNDLVIADGKKKSEQVITLKAGAFQAGGFVLDIANFVDNSNSLFSVSDDSPFGDQDTNPATAMQRDLEYLLTRFEKVSGALVSTVDGVRMRRYFMLKQLYYFYDGAVLNMTVMWTGDEEEVPDVRPEAPAPAASSSKKGLKEITEEGVDDPCKTVSAEKSKKEAMQDNCRVTLAMDRYDAIVELQQGAAKEAGLSVAAKLRTCSDYRMVQLTCNGLACRTKLYSAGITEGWPSGSTGFHNLVSANDCCKLFMVCNEELRTAPWPVQCEMLDDNSLWWAINVGDPMRPSSIDWQAACQPTCYAVAGDNSIDPTQWKPCRFGRQRCEGDCRCSFFC